MKKLNVAIIGQGRSGRDIHGHYFKSEQNTLYNVVAVVEWDENRRARAAMEYPGCTVYEDYRDLFARDDIDLVVNATYSNLHYPITKDLLEHGKNVLVEKPFARTYFECNDLMETAKRNGVTLGVFQQSFYAPYYRKVKEILASNKLGDLLQVSIAFSGFSRRWDWQTLQKKLGGGAYNTGPHPLGFALDFLDFSDDMQVVFSRLGMGLTSGDANDYAKVILTAPGKPVVDVEVSSVDAFSPYNIKIQGTRGTLLCTTAKYKMKYIIAGENEPRPVIEDTLRREDGTPNYCSEKLITHEEEADIAGDLFLDASVIYYQTMYEKLVNGTPLPIGPEHAAKVIQVLETMHAQNPLPIKF